MFGFVFFHPSGLERQREVKAGFVRAVSSHCFPAAAEGDALMVVSEKFLYNA